MAEWPHAPVLKTGSASSQTIAEVSLPDSEDIVLPSGLPDSVKIDADLRHVMATWPTLSVHIKAAILTLVDAEQ